jgi:hypothetical protein
MDPRVAKKEDKVGGVLERTGAANHAMKPHPQ